MTVEVITVKSEGLTLSKIIWQFLKRQPLGYLEVVLEANPGLAGNGPFLPVGTEVILPLDNIPAVRTERSIITLWD